VMRAYLGTEEVTAADDAAPSEGVA
jgi:hypothetical protein